MLRIQQERVRFNTKMNAQSSFNFAAEESLSTATEKRRRKRARKTEKKNEALANQYPFMKYLKEKWQLTDNAFIRILSSFSQIVKGNDSVLLSPVAHEHSPKVIYDNFLNLVLANGFNDLIVEVQEAENSNLKKYGPRSIQAPLEERWNGILEHFKQFTVPEHLLNDLNEVADLTSGNYRPVSFDTAVSKLRGSTSAGLPTLGNKAGAKLQNIENFDEWLSNDLACLLYTRTQENNKTRLVWGYPTVNMIDEQRYYLPILKHQQNNVEWRKAIVGTDQTDKKITEIIDFAHANDLYIVSVDFSSYDATVGIDLQTAAFRYINNLYQDQYSDEILRIAYNFLHIPLLTPRGLLSGPHGVPSGSAFTNEIDSIAQYLIAVSSGLVYIDYMQIQGDDGVYVTSDPDGLTEYFKLFGLQPNDKGLVSKTTVVYLQKIYNAEYRLPNGIIGGIYPVSRALLRLVYLERFVELKDVSLNTKEYFAVRAIAILENCKYHPLFKQFVNFVMELDQLGLCVSPNALKEYVRFISEKSGRFDNVTNQYGDELTGIANFETVKYINSLKT